MHLAEIVKIIYASRLARLDVEIVKATATTETNGIAPSRLAGKHGPPPHKLATLAIEHQAYPLYRQSIAQLP